MKNHIQCYLIVKHGAKSVEKVDNISCKKRYLSTNKMLLYYVAKVGGQMYSTKQKIELDILR